MPHDVVIVLGTDVKFVQALTDVNMRVGPGVEYRTLGKVFAGQTAKVTGVSSNGLWWRVVCPDGSTGNCWVTASAQYTQPTGGTAPTPQPQPQPGGIPTIAVSAVMRDQIVTITAKNFPANQSFDVRMGAFGTQAPGGTYVGSTSTGNGTFTATYTIPANLRTSTRIAIRLDGPSGYYSYNWFWNNTAN